jgi:hypothetical protein
LSLTKEKEYTYHEFRTGVLRSASRIDQIWIHPQYLDRIQKYQIEDTDLFAKSDHHMVVVSIDASQWWDNRQFRRNKRTNQSKKFLWNLKEVTTEQWEKFASTLENELMASTEHINENAGLERQWNAFKKAIISAGNQELPKSKEPKNKVNMCRNTHKDFNTINLLSKIHRVGKVISEGKTISPEIKVKFETNCALLN